MDHYVVEYETEGGHGVAYMRARNAFDALAEFRRIHPEATDVKELRRNVH